MHASKRGQIAASRVENAIRDSKSDAGEDDFRRIYINCAWYRGGLGSYSCSCRCEFEILQQALHLEDPGSVTNKAPTSKQLRIIDITFRRLRERTPTSHPRYARLLHLCFLSFCFVTTCERGNSFCVRRQQFKYLMMGEAAESRKLAHLAPTVTSEVRFSSFYSSFERMARLHTFVYAEKGQNKGGYYADKARNLGTCQSFALFCPCVKS